MKKLISILMFVLMMGIVFAQNAPTPVIGKLIINGVQPTGYQIEVRNLDNPEAELINIEDSASLMTERGTFTFDLGWFGRDANNEIKYTPKFRTYAGDRIEVKIVRDGQGNSLSGTQFVKVIYPSPLPYYFDFKIDDVSVKVVVKEYVCFDGTKVTDQSKCPQPYTCSNGVLVKTKEDCPVESKEYEDKTIAILTGVGSGLGVVGIIALYRYYRKKKQIPRAEKMAKTYIEKRKK